MFQSRSSNASSRVPPPAAKQDVARQVRRTVGLAALRRIHRLLEDARTEERRALRAALITLVALLVAFAAGVIWYLSAGGVSTVILG